MMNNLKKAAEDADRDLRVSNMMKNLKMAAEDADRDLTAARDGAPPKKKWWRPWAFGRPPLGVNPWIKDGRVYPSNIRAEARRREKERKGR
jgi:hypothetical protein